MRKMRRRALRAAVLGLVGTFMVAPLATRHMRAHRCRRRDGGPHLRGRRRDGHALERRRCRDLCSRHEYGGELRRGDAREHRADHRDRKYLCGHADRRRVGGAVRGPGRRRALAHHCESRSRRRRHLAAPRRRRQRRDRRLSRRRPRRRRRARPDLQRHRAPDRDRRQRGGRLRVRRRRRRPGRAARLPGHAQRRRRRRHAARRRARRHVLGRRGRGRRHLRRPPRP